MAGRQRDLLFAAFVRTFMLPVEIEGLHSE